MKLLDVVMIVCGLILLGLSATDDYYAQRVNETLKRENNDLRLVIADTKRAHAHAEETITLCDDTLNHCIIRLDRATHAMTRAAEQLREDKRTLDSCQVSLTSTSVGQRSCYSKRWPPPSNAVCIDGVAMQPITPERNTHNP